MCSSCKGKAYQIEQSRDGVNDEKGGERGASAGGDTEVGLGAIIAEAFIRVVADAGTRASLRRTEAEDTKVDSLTSRNWHAFDDRRREDGE